MSYDPREFIDGAYRDFVTKKRPTGPRIRQSTPAKSMFVVGDVIKLDRKKYTVTRVICPRQIEIEGGAVLTI